ncbi:MAG: hypothetical protein ACT4QG_02650 [Sporichthyaceae bacterium]
MTVLGSRPEAPAAPAARRGPNGLVKALVGGFLLFAVANFVVTGLTDPAGDIPPVVLDPHSKVPVVPTNADFPYDLSNTIWAIVLLGGLGLAGFVLAIREALKNRDYLPVFIGLGTIAVVIPEVFVDIVGMVYYPTHSGDFAFEIFGRRMGWFILAAWFGAGAFAGMMLKALRARPTAKQVWILIAATAISYTIFEEILVTAGGMYHYYGNQPLWWHSLPLWWTPCNVIGCALLPAAFAYRYQHLLRGWRASVMVLVVPACVAGGYAFIAMPSWIVVNADYPWLVNEFAGLGTVLLSFGLIAVVMNLFMGYKPFDPDSTPWPPGTSPRYVPEEVAE